MMTTAIIEVGQLGSAAVAKDLGPSAISASVSQAIADADTVVFAVWLDMLAALVADNTDRLNGKVVVDQSNPIKLDGNGVDETDTRA